MKLHFKNKFEKAAFYALLPILAVAIVAFIWAHVIMEEISPGYISRALILLLIIVACVVFGPMLVFSAWLVVSVIQRGASPYVIVGTIAACIYVNVVLSRYGVFGAWMLFRK